MNFVENADLVSCGFSTAASAAVEIDCKDNENVLFIGVPGTTAARTWSLSLKTGATTTGFVNCSTAHTLESTAAGNDILITEVVNSPRRWVGATFASTTATPAWLLAFRLRQRSAPTGFSSTANLPVASGGYKLSVAPTS